MTFEKMNDAGLYTDPHGLRRSAALVASVAIDPLTGAALSATAQRRYTLLSNATATDAMIGPLDGGSYIWRCEAGTWNGCTATLKSLGLDGVTWSPVRNAADTANVTMTANGTMAVAIAQGSILQVEITGGPPTAFNSALGGIGGLIAGLPLVPTSKAVSVPFFSVAPSITGNPFVGQTLTLSPGTVDAFPAATLAIQWLRNGTPIVGATGTTYVTTGDDARKVISADVRASSVIGTAIAVAAGVLVTREQAGGPAPLNGYVFLMALQPDGSHVALTGLNPNSSRSTLQGKAA